MAITAAEILFSLGTWAAELGTTRDVLRRILAMAGAVPAGKRSGHPLYRGRDICEAWATHRGASAGDPDELPPLERKAHWQAEHEKLRFKLECQEVVPMMEVEHRFGGRNKMLVQKLDIAPDVLERDVGLNAMQAARLEKHLDELREALFALMTEEDEDDAVRDSA